MQLREMLTIAGVSLAVITAYSLARDLTDEPMDLTTPQTGVVQLHAQVNVPHE